MGVPISHRITFTSADSWLQPFVDLNFTSGNQMGVAWRQKQLQNLLTRINSTASHFCCSYIYDLLDLCVPLDFTREPNAFIWRRLFLSFFLLPGAIRLCLRGYDNLAGLNGSSAGGTRIGYSFHCVYQAEIESSLDDTHTMGTHVQCHGLILFYVEICTKSDARRSLRAE